MSEKIIFKKDSCVQFNLKKRDRLLISGPCEIELDDVQVSHSLDYELKLTLSMPQENRVVKLGEGTKLSEAQREKRRDSQFFQQPPRNKTTGFR